MDAITFEPFSFDFLNIPKASLFFYSDSLKQQEGDHYTPFVEKKYYDEKNRILAFGDINSKGDLIEFSNDTYALIDDCRLAAVYIRVSINVIESIKKKEKYKKVFKIW